MSEKRTSELRKRALTSELANMQDTDRREVLAMLVAQLSYDEIEQLCVIPYRELNSRGATRAGHRKDRFDRPSPQSKAYAS